LNQKAIQGWGTRRKLCRAGLLDEAPSAAATSDVRLLPVVHEESAAHEHDKSALEEEEAASPVASLAAPSAAAIQVEFPGPAFVSVVGSAGSAVIHGVLESLRG
jgi:hypothetical protein